MNMHFCRKIRNSENSSVLVCDGFPYQKYKSVFNFYLEFRVYTCSFSRHVCTLCWTVNNEHIDAIKVHSYLFIIFFESLKCFGCVSIGSLASYFTFLYSPSKAVISSCWCASTICLYVFRKKTLKLPKGKSSKKSGIQSPWLGGGFLKRKKFPQNS